VHLKPRERETYSKTLKKKNPKTYTSKRHKTRLGTGLGQDLAQIERCTSFLNITSLYNNECPLHFIYIYKVILIKLPFFKTEIKTNEQE